MIDFHAHLLPGVDDGSDSVETSLRMLERWGDPALICATPHFYADRDDPERFLRRRAGAWSALSDALPEGSPAIRLGAEVHYFDGMSRAEALAALCLEGTSLLLVELPFGAWTRRVYTELEQLRQRGFVPVAAHVERYLGWNGSEALSALEDREILLQCNAEWFLSRAGARRAMRLLEAGRVQFLGSDAHNTDARPPRLREAWERIERKLGRGPLDRLAETAARFGLITEESV